MVDFITLSCPSCGGKLQITKDIERFACGNCGTEHIVKRAGGIISLAPVVEGLKGVKSGVDKTASELAIIRIDKEIEKLSNEIHYLETMKVKRLHQSDQKLSRIGSSNWFVFLILLCIFTGISTLEIVISMISNDFESYMIILLTLSLTVFLISLFIVIVMKRRVNRVYNQTKIAITEEIEEINKSFETKIGSLNDQLLRLREELRRHQELVEKI